MDYIAILKADLEKGYSKADLEKLIGLPKNNLSGIIKGDKKLSRKSELKIEQWEASEKPNPLELEFNNKFIKRIEDNWSAEGDAIANAIKDLHNGTLTTKGIIPQITTTETDNEQLITQYEEELTRLGTSQIAKERGKWLTKKIYELKYPKQND